VPSQKNGESSFRREFSGQSGGTALERELSRARAEGRWEDADRIASEIEARSKVIDFAARRLRK
jgi:hypothetical protein